MLRTICAAIAVLALTVVVLAAAEADRDGDGFVPLFNGKNLDGWEGNFDLWKVQQGMIVGLSPGIKRNEFLATKATYEDFELQLEFRLHEGKGNSGIQFRSKRLPAEGAVQGYQADSGENFWGALYDEHRRRKVLARPPKELESAIKKDGWNRYTIRAKGNHIVLRVNGKTMVDYREPDGSIARRGIIALQIHSGPPMRIDFRNIRIRELTR